MKIIAITETGVNKSENEDRIIIGKSIIANGVFSTEIKEGNLAIADGVGGNNAGSVASSYVANQLCGLEKINIETFSKINNELIDLSKQRSEYEGMATTLSGVHISQVTTLYNVGNSRVYLLQSRKYLKQLTSDDTTLNYLLTTGQLAAEDAESFEKKNEITACFGGGSSALFRIKVSNIETFNSPIMITSDGVHDYITIDQMEEIIGEFGISEKACEVMIKKARLCGSCDDISIVLGDE